MRICHTQIDSRPRTWSEQESGTNAGKAFSGQNVALGEETPPNPSQTHRYITCFSVSFKFSPDIQLCYWMGLREGGGSKCNILARAFFLEFLVHSKSSTWTLFLSGMFSSMKPPFDLLGMFHSKLEMSDSPLIVILEYIHKDNGAWRVLIHC